MRKTNYAILSSLRLKCAGMFFGFVLRNFSLWKYNLTRKGP